MEPSEPQDRLSWSTVDWLSPELHSEKLILLSMDGKLLVPELSRIRSELALPLDTELPPELPPGYLSRHRRSLPTFPAPASPQTPAELRSSSNFLCAGHFPTGLSRVVTGMQSPGSPRRRRGPLTPGSGRGGGGH